MAGGILKNKLEEENKQNINISESTKEFREQVLKNTKLNALLKKDFDPNQLDDEELKQYLNSKHLLDEDKEKLKWNNQNLDENEVLQKQILENLTQTIDEPKTPFQKASDPSLNEYYQDDVEEELDNFSLGEPEISQSESADHSQDSRIIKTNEHSNTTTKRSFEELRKQHYHNEHVHISDNDEEIDQDDDNDEAEENDEDQIEGPPKPKKSFAELRKEHYAHEHPPLGQTLNVEDDDDDDDE